MRLLVTGGLGFIGSAVVRRLIAETDHEVFNLDRISYASTNGSVESVAEDDRYSFLRCDLADTDAVHRLINDVRPDAVIHLAAESHVDRSIDDPGAFIQSNVVGTFNLLEAVRRIDGLHRFIHVSTDEVFGSLTMDDPKSDEDTAYDPRSPYSATKAASDHLVRAWGETYGMPCCISNCSNNYGPYQFPEKMIPLMTIKAWRRESLPVYGLGLNVRDWLHVDDHAAAILAILDRGEVGRTYTVGGDSEMANIDVVERVCRLVGEVAGDGFDRRQLIEFVTDRPGHDLRYAIDSTRITRNLGWRPDHDFESGLAATVDWYLSNQGWWQSLMDRGGAGERLGLQGVAL